MGTHRTQRTHSRLDKSLRCRPGKLQCDSRSPREHILWKWKGDPALAAELLHTLKDFTLKDSRLSNELLVG